MFRILALLFCLLAHTPAWAAIAASSAIGTANSTSSGTTLVLTAAGTVEVGNIALVRVANDNIGTDDQAHSEVTITDSAGNTYTELCAWRNGQGAAAAGATGSVHFTKAVTQITSGSTTITATFTSAIVMKTMEVREFTVAAGNTFIREGPCQTLSVDAGDAGSMSISGLANQEWLFVRAIAHEALTTTMTVTAGYAAFASAHAVGADDASSMSLRGEFDIITATGSTSNPTFADTNDDSASVFMAIKEGVPGPDAIKVQTIQ